jgi:hypothetical protein
MMEMSLFEIWIGAFVTLALFSFLYKDNPVYRLVEHVFAGLSAGYYWGLIWESVILQQLWHPFKDNHQYWLIVPFILGLLMFSRFVKKYSWISRISLAFVMGNTAGIFLISQLHGFVLPQMRSTMTAQVANGQIDYVLTAIVVVGVISTLIYFYFSKEHKGILGATAKVGIWFIMIAFGAHFGYTVMGRVSLLIGRVQFLIETWIGSFSHFM